jgi:O-antigen ligase
MIWRGVIKTAILLVVVSLCLLEFVFHRHSSVFSEYEITILQTRWVLFFSLAVWCSAFLFFAFSRKDWPLIILVFVAITKYLIYPAPWPETDAITFLFSVTIGKIIRFFLGSRNCLLEVEFFLVGLVLLLAFSFCWHQDMTNNFYRGPRWMGFWNNPNTYGMLMGAGMVLALALGLRGWRVDIRRWITILCLVTGGMLGVGLVMSYSRGAWLGAGMGLLYLAWGYGKLKWRHIVIGSGALVLGAGLIWGRTPDSAPWYVKRADLGRPSAQNRVTAWRAGLQMMWDHPLGVGWNQAVNTYAKNYSPPEGGAAAMITNDYLMLGTELGIPALLCFLGYVGLCFRKSPRLHLTPALSPFCSADSAKRGEGEALRAACLAGALVLVVAFWFDGGLFKLPTAAVFWVLLELGAGGRKEDGGERIEDDKGKTISS